MNWTKFKWVKFKVAEQKTKTQPQITYNISIKNGENMIWNNIGNTLYSNAMPKIVGNDICMPTGTQENWTHHIVILLVNSV